VVGDRALLLSLYAARISENNTLVLMGHFDPIPRTVLG
jgi:hypothetical protein